LNSLLFVYYFCTIFVIQQKKLTAVSPFSIYFKGNEKITINGLHGVLAFYRLYVYLGMFWIMDHYTVLHFDPVEVYGASGGLILMDTLQNYNGHLQNPTKF
jgi:hypothetical protein